MPGLVAAAIVTIGGYTFDLPPAHYIRQPGFEFAVRHVGPVIVSIMCGEREGRVVLGCTFRGGSMPVVFIIEGLDPVLEAAVFLHEIGHLNGWKH